MLTVTHSTVVNVPDDPSYPVGSDEWNAAHAISGVLPVANGGSGVTLATTNVDYYVATTGSDSNAGTISAPFLTVQAAINAATAIDYQLLYTLTIHVSDGTYAKSDGFPNALFRQLINYPPDQNPLLVGNTSTPTNCLLSNSVTYAVTTDIDVNWEISGFQLKSTTGVHADLWCNQYSQVVISHIDFAGSGELIKAQNHSSIYYFNATGVTISSTAFTIALDAFFYSSIINDGSVITITNPCTASSRFAQAVDNSILGDGTFSGGSNVTGPRLQLSNNSYAESPFTRGSWPGTGIVEVMYDCSYYGDVQYQFETPSSGGTITVVPGATEVFVLSADLSTITITMPQVQLIDNLSSIFTQPVIIRFTFVSNAVAITWANHSGDTASLVFAPAGAGAGQTITLGYVASANLWVNLGISAPGAFDNLGNYIITPPSGSSFVVVGGNFVTGFLSRGVPTTHTADFSVGATENWIINNKSGSSCVVTLPSASTYFGREITLNNYQAQTVVSASTNVIPLAGGSASTAILAATAGKWAKLVSNATNWVIMQSN